jgi:hypothetical protein
MKIANPANIDAYFTELKNLWLERNSAISGGSFSQVIIQPQPQETATIPQKEKLSIRLARDLQYLGIAMDDETLEKFIYNELGRRLEGKTAHVKKSPFAPRSVYTTKKVVRKVTPKKASSKV